MSHSTLAAPHPLAILSWGCYLKWTALPLQASVGSKLRTAARGADAAIDERVRARWITLGV
jgi:hypothetical protein